jgi:hypothetical protein
MLISTALLLDSIIRNSVCTPAKLPCRRVEVGYKRFISQQSKTITSEKQTSYSSSSTEIENIIKQTDFILYRLSQKYRLSLKVRHLEVLWSTEKYFKIFNICCYSDS